MAKFANFHYQHYCFEPTMNNGHCSRRASSTWVVQVVWSWPPGRLAQVVWLVPRHCSASAAVALLGVAINLMSCKRVTFGCVVQYEIPCEERGGTWSIDAERFRRRIHQFDQLFARVLERLTARDAASEKDGNGCVSGVLGKGAGNYTNQEPPVCQRDEQNV